MLIIKKGKVVLFLKQTNKKTPPIFYVGILVLVLTLFSSHMTSGLYARFITSETASDSAKVAKFDIGCEQISGVPMSIVLDFFDPELREDSIQFCVTSTSEVAVEYDVSIILPGKMAQWVDENILLIQMDGNAPESIDVAAGMVTFEGNYFAAAESGSYTHTITFTVPTGAMPGEIVKITEDATLRIRAEQVD